VKREYCIHGWGNGDHCRDTLKTYINVGDRVVDFEVRAQGPDDSEIRFTLDWPGVDEWLEDKVRRILRSFEEATDWTVYRTSGFVDLSFPPVPNPEAKFLYEYCEIGGPKRYAAIAHFFDGYRFYAGPIDRESDDVGLLDIEPSLTICVIRVAHYIATGEGRSIVLPASWAQRKEMAQH
jgi:hypothetical protein